MILAVARKNYLVEATRWSYDSWNIFHRFLGRASLFFAVVHTALYCGYVYEKGENFGPLWSLNYWNAGVAGTLAMCWLAGPPSVRWARQRDYEFFLALHVLMTVGLLYLCFVHIFWMFSVEWLWGAVAVWGMDRAMRLWLSQGATSKAISEIKGEVIRLTVPVGPGKALLKKPGQFVYLRFPQLSWIQKHPFSIAGVREVTAVDMVDTGDDAVPLLNTGKQHQHLELVFTIRPYRGVTKALHALGNTTVQVAVEGAYKHHIPLPDDTVFFAAGVGFALVLGYLRARKGGKAYWAVGRSEDLWAFEELFAECEEGELDGLMINYSGLRMADADRLERLGIKINKSRLRISEVLDEWEQDSLKGEKGERAVMACGPERFLDECRVCVDALDGVEYWEEVSTK
ncbi:hypothetical protein BJ508DRAFT_410245 [Ascobolus immersus RN42]|uniref:FAD-binding FR-type domain-containing protein n=1 Tax=Ascobolus immersus RN42 TaxID=1160509 RepID=A0A3N4IP11_ASCIM|nr:hypothetical protein BJ508DRAFT_410245 [Ascobolus immersus RN42]